MSRPYKSPDKVPFHADRPHKSPIDQKSIVAKLHDYKLSNNDLVKILAILGGGRGAGGDIVVQKSSIIEWR